MKFILIVYGERPMDASNNKLSRLRKEIKISKDVI